jgi:hypothetical protein
MSGLLRVVAGLRIARSTGRLVAARQNEGTVSGKYCVSAKDFVVDTLRPAVVVGALRATEGGLADEVNARLRCRVKGATVAEPRRSLLSEFHSGLTMFGDFRT